MDNPSPSGIYRRPALIFLAILALIILVAVIKNQAGDNRALSLRPAADLLEQYRARGIPVVVFFSSPDCSSCKQVQESLDEVFPEFEQSIALLKVDVTDVREREFVDRTGVQLTPTLLFIQAGGAEKQLAGEISPQALRSELAILAGGAP